MTSPAGSWTQRRAKWRRYRVGRTLTYVGIFLYLPVMVALTLAFNAVGWGDDALMWIAGVWMSACVVNGLWFTTFRCPECGKRFFPNGCQLDRAVERLGQQVPALRRPRPGLTRVTRPRARAPR